MTGDHREDPLIGSVEAAGILGIDPSTITRWVEKGIVTPVTKAPGRYGAFMFSRSQIVRLARERLARRAS